MLDGGGFDVDCRHIPSSPLRLSVVLLLFVCLIDKKQKKHSRSGIQIRAQRASSAARSSGHITNYLGRSLAHICRAFVHDYEARTGSHYLIRGSNSVNSPTYFVRSNFGTCHLNVCWDFTSDPKHLNTYSTGCRGQVLYRCLQACLMQSGVSV